MPEKREIPSTEAEKLEAQKAQEQANRPSNEANLFWQEQVADIFDSRLEKMGEYFNNLKFSQAVNEGKHESERDAALTAIQKYIVEARENLKREILKLDNPKDRVKWIDLLKEAERKVENYQGVVFAFLAEFQDQTREKSPDGFGLNELWKIAARGNEIYREMKANEKYGEIITEASTDKEMSATSFDFIYEKIQKRPSTGPVTPEDSLKLLEMSGVAAIFAAMDGTDRMQFASHLITSKKSDAMAVISSLVGSNFLSIGQAEQLLEKAESAGLISSQDKPALLTSFTKKQEDNAAWEESIDMGKERREYRNQAQHLFEPKILGGLLLTVWRGLNMLVSLIAYRKDPLELLKSPYFYLDVAGIGTGLSLMQNKNILSFLTNMTEGEQNQKEHMERLANLMAVGGRYPAVSKAHLEKPGLIEAIVELRKDHRNKGIKESPTFEEIMEKNVNDESKKELAKMQPAEKEQLMKIVDQIFFAPEVKDTASYVSTMETYRKSQSIS